MKTINKNGLSLIHMKRDGVWGWPGAALLVLEEEEDEEEEEEDGEGEDGDWFSYLWGALNDVPSSFCSHLWSKHRQILAMSGTLLSHCWTTTKRIIKRTTARPVSLSAGCLCTSRGADHHLVAGAVAAPLASSTYSFSAVLALKIRVLKSSFQSHT